MIWGGIPSSWNRGLCCISKSKGRRQDGIEDRMESLGKYNIYMYHEVHTKHLWVRNLSPSKPCVVGTCIMKFTLLLELLFLIIRFLKTSNSSASAPSKPVNGSSLLSYLSASCTISIYWALATCTHRNSRSLKTALWMLAKWRVLAMYFTVSWNSGGFKGSSGTAQGV